MLKRICALAGMAFVIVACEPGSAAMDAASDAHGGTQIDGMQEPLDNTQLAAVSDLVVVGHAKSENELAFTANPLIPDSAKSEEGYENGTFYEVAFVVDEVLSGSTSVGETLKVARLANFIMPNGSKSFVSGNEDVELSPGGEYVLFLDAGNGVWTGNYIAQGPQGVGDVDGLTVTFRDGDSTTLTQLRTDLAD